MTLSLKEWAEYRDLLSKLSQKAADEFKDAVWSKNGRWHGAGLGAIPRSDLEDYAYALVTKYSEGSTELACEMYDKMAKMSGKKLPPAEPADTASIYDVRRSLNSAISTSSNQDYVSSTLGRFVKQASQDTTLKNAQRDGAEFAWIPSGDPCPFCIILASNGWRTVSKKSLKDGHAEHIHNNCNCAYAVRFDSKTNVQGYDPDEYYEQYKDAEGRSTNDKVNSMRRIQYKENKDVINAQKREAYAERQNDQLLSSHITNMYDEYVGKSVGAKFENYDIMDLSTGEFYHLAEGTHLQDKEVFAGKGSNEVYRKAEYFANKFGGKPEDWQHVKAKGYVETEDGTFLAEIHWSQCEGIGKQKMFVKRWLE